MALTKASRSMLNTGISDSSDATALTFDSSENATFAGNASLADSKYLNIGTGSDLKLWHDGSHSRINNATGNFNIQANDFHITDSSNSSARFIVDHDGATTLYYNGNSKLATANDGIDVTGKIDCTTFESSGAATIGGALTVTGNLQVDGTTTTINSTTYTVDDKNITLASGAGSSSAADGAGITIDGASATWNYVHSTTSWDSNKPIRSTNGFVGPLTGNVTGNASGTAATVTGAAQSAITSVGTLTTLTVDDITINGSEIVDQGGMTIAGETLTLRTDASNWTTALSIDAAQGTTLAGHLIVNGNTTLGNADTDTVTVPGPLAVDTDTLYVDVTNDRVGINVGTSPLQALDIQGYVKMASNRTDDAEKHAKLMGVPYDSGSTSDIAGLYINGHAGGNYLRYGGGVDSTSAATTHTFYTAALTTGAYEGTHRLHIAADGKVGIGTLSPTAKLHVEVADGAEFLKVTQTGNEHWAFKVASGAGATDYMSVGISSGTQAMVWQEDGKVGIGDTAPFSKLHVEDTSWSSGAPYGAVASITGNNVNDNNWGHLIVTDSSTANGNGGSIRFGTGTADSSNLNPFAGIQGVAEGTSYGGLALYTRPSGGTAASRMVIDSTGKAGMGGNTTPKYQLDVNAANNTLAASFGHQIGNGNWTGIHFGYKEPANTDYRKSALVFERVDNSLKMDGTSRSNNAGGRIHMLNANYGSSTASNLTQYSQDHEDGHVVATWHTDGSYETIHAAEWTHGTTTTETHYDRQRKSLTETIYDSQYISLNPPAYSNGNYYVLVGVRSGTADRSVTFKVDLLQASWIFFEAKFANSADGTTRGTKIEYSFDNITYTQLQANASWGAGSTDLRDTVFFNTTNQNNYTGQIYLRATITGASSSHNTLVGWQGFKIKAMAQSMSFNTNKTFRGADRYIGQFCTNATQNSAIVSANNGHFRFATHMDEDLDTDIMEARTSGNFGVQFKKAGWVKLDFHQDIITTGSTGYMYVYVYRGTASQVDGNTANLVAEMLDTNTNSQWSMIRGGALIKVAANDVIACKMVAAGVSALDSTSWSHWIFDWFEQKVL